LKEMTETWGMRADSRIAPGPRQRAGAGLSRV
jgi:hypothetical protein